MILLGQTGAGLVIGLGLVGALAIAGIASGVKAGPRFGIAIAVFLVLNLLGTIVGVFVEPPGGLVEATGLMYVYGFFVGAVFLFRPWFRGMGVGFVAGSVLGMSLVYYYSLEH